MASCEKCWGDAWLRSQNNDKSQSDNYQELLIERQDNQCTVQEQAGQFWDEEKQRDRRKI